MPRFKTFEIEAKSMKLSDEGGGSITGYAATWVRKADCWGDVIARGAFAEDIAQKREAGAVLPFLWNHDSNDMGQGALFLKSSAWVPVAQILCYAQRM